MLTGRRIKGKEAELYKLVNKSFENVDKMEEQINSFMELLRTSGPKAISHCKKLIYDVLMCYHLTKHMIILQK